MFTLTKEKGVFKMKEPVHPGKILHDILICEGYYYYEKLKDKEELEKLLQFGDASESLCLEKEWLKDFIVGKYDLGYTDAYKLGKYIKGTDMALWLKLQDEYNEYIQKMQFQTLNCFMISR